MMVLYSGTTCPFSHRCRFVLFEKGMDFEIRDVDLYNKPEDINVMNPYGQVPILVERDLILYESNIINEYIDERFPHPQLMPGDPVDRARVRLFLLNFEKELFVHVSTLESRAAKSNEKALEKARSHIRDRLTQLAPVFLKNKYMLGDNFSMLDVAIAPLLWRLDYYGIELVQERGAAAEVRRAHFLAPGLHRGADAVRKGHAQVELASAHVAVMINALESTSTRPYLIRALYEWCTDNGFTPYVAVLVDDTVQVPREYVKNGEIVLNISFDATSSLKLGNEFIEFKARFAGTAREIMRAGQPRDRDLRPRERAGHGLSGARVRQAPAKKCPRPRRCPACPAAGSCKAKATPRWCTWSRPSPQAPDNGPDGEPPRPPGGPRPTLKRVK